MAEKLLRTIATDMSSLSLDEARKAVLEAQSVLNSLQNEQLAAEKVVAQASRDVSKAKSAQKNGIRINSGGKGTSASAEPLYSDKSFWETRYKETKTEPSSAMYEWYLSFEEWKPHLLPLLTPIKQMPLHHDGRVDALLVSGCGNSSLCEDLVDMGFTNVAGFDYSPSVVATMQQRAVDKGISSVVRYYDADARDMKNDHNDKYAAVIDKGTLDAIASGDTREGSDCESGAMDAATYMLEMWRIIVIGGKFLVLSTMPPDIFYALAIEPLIALGATKCEVCDWDNALRQYVTTAEGGDVYFYAIAKLMTPNAAHKQPPKQGPLASARKERRSKEDIMAGIQALLQEAKQAKLEMDAASAKCESRTADARAALTALDDAEKERKKIEKKLEVSEVALSKSVPLDVNNTNTNNNTAEKSGGTMSTAASAPPPEPAPKVNLGIVPEQSDNQAGGYVVVQYTLPEGAWNEDDAIHLVCISQVYTGADRGGNYEAVEMYAEQDDNKYEQLEYTVKPTPSGGDSVNVTGQIKLQLPAVCSTYTAVYVRTTSSWSTIAGVASIQRTANRLAQTDAFMVPARVLLGHHDGATCSALNFLVDPFSADSTAAPRSLRRRGAAPITSTLVPVAEDLRSIRTIGISMFGSQHLANSVASTRYCLTRVMVWAFSSSSNAASSRQQPSVVNIVVEADVATIDKGGGGAMCTSLQTCYGLIELPMDEGLRFDLSGALVEIEFGTEDKPHKMNCRLPYNYVKAVSGGLPPPRIGFLPAGNRGIDLQATGENSNAEFKAAVSCAFCGNDLVPHNRINQALPLPSGLLDSVMHEFICSELVPAMNLCIADMSTPEGSVMIGPVQANINPLDMMPHSVTLACKGAPTILDLFSGYGGSLATTPMPMLTPTPQGKTGTDDAGSMPMASLINIDTCLVLCARCGSYIGDGQLAADCPCPMHVQQSGANISAASFAEEPAPVLDAGESRDAGTNNSNNLFVLNDLRDVRLAKYCVELHLSDFFRPDTASAMFERSLSVEQGIARIVSHLSGVYSIGSFLLFVPNQETVLFVRILSRDFAVSLPAPFAESGQTGQMHEAIKISHQRGHRASMALTGAEARVALQQHELKIVGELLNKRSILFGPSIFKKHSLGVLLT